MKIASRVRLALPLLAPFLWAPAARAYDIETHSAISRNAFRVSIISTYIPRELSLDPNHEFEGPAILSFPASRRQLVDWVRQGAKDEDDTLTLGLDPIAAHYLNHFYNPLDGSGLYFLTGLPPPIEVLTGLPSPTWGIEFQPISGQDFSFTDARQYLYDVLTEPGPTDREHSLALTFLTLGHVIHLIQDMAQPQHTRNDSHGPGPFGGLSLYERYTDENRSRLTFDGYVPVYRDQDTTTFNFVYDFWHRAGGMGLADYSNRGFVSAGTNFCAADDPASCPGSVIPPSVLQPYDILPHAGFPNPNGQAATIIRERIEDLPYTASGLTGDIDFIATPVYDAYLGATDENRLTSTYSIFDPDLQQTNRALGFTLNRFNFDDAQALLIPRAVAYSAGLINYFFRGRIDLACDGADTMYPCVIKNLGDDDLNGTFKLYWDDAAGNRSGPVATWSPGIVAANHSVRVAGFAAPDNAARYILVFRGKIGLEADAVTGKVISNSFLAMTGVATYAYHPTDAAANVTWEQLTRGPLRLPHMYSSEQRGAAQGVAVDDRLLFASFSFDTDEVLGPIMPVWKSTDGGRSFSNIADTFSPWSLSAVTYLGGTELLGAFYRATQRPGVGAVQIVGFAYSNDLGATWQLRDDRFWNDHEPGVQYVGNGTVIAHGLQTGDGSGLLRSTDRGRTWSEIKPFIDGAEWTCPYVFRGSAPQCAGTSDCTAIPDWAFIDPWRSMWSYNYCPGLYGICEQRANNEDTTPEPACYGRWFPNSIASNNVEGEGGVLLVGGVAYRENSIGYEAFPQYGIWKSTDRGEHWRWVLDTGAHADWPNLMNPLYPNYNSRTVISVAITPSGEALATAEGYGRTGQDLFYRSTDAGETWTEIENRLETRVIGVMHLGGTPRGS